MVRNDTNFLWGGKHPSVKRPKKIILCDKLETLQEKYIRMMLEVPVSTPKMALRAETGLLSMKHRIWNEKVNLISAIRRMKEGLAKQVYEEQVLNGWPGLAQEVSDICLTTRLIYYNVTYVTYFI
jgi:hypothetical protein